MKRHAEKPIEATGTVVFLLFNIGSKSEGRYPFLYVDRDTVYRLSLKEAVSYDDRELLPYDGKRVKASGVLSEDIRQEFAVGTLVADSVVPGKEPDHSSDSEQ
jgi:hypothetical protein